MPEIKEEPIDAEPSFDIQKWLGVSRMRVSRPFISTVDDVVVGNITMDSPKRVLNTLERPSWMISSIIVLILKRRSLLERVSEAVIGQECLLLEGSTATSKTSSILYLAAELVNR